MHIFVNGSNCHLCCSSCKSHILNGTPISCTDEGASLRDIRGRLEAIWMEENGDANDIRCHECRLGNKNTDEKISELRSAIKSFWQSCEKPEVSDAVRMCERILDLVEIMVK